MSPKTFFRSLSSVTVALSLPFQAVATLNPDLPRGEEIVQILLPQEKSEICVVPSHYEDGKYSEKDLKSEKALCSLNESTNVATCPKLNSTNPGVEFYPVPEGISPREVEAKKCFIPKPENPKDNSLKKYAKYKQSISCSYTPSIIGYYHLSRMLGGAANVPPAVLRTMNIERHKQLAALGVLRAQDNPHGKEALIYKTWAGLQAALNAGKASRHKDVLFTDAIDQTYGALQLNPTNEENYTDLFNRAKDTTETRAAAFGNRNPHYQFLTQTAPLSTLVGREFNAANVQRIVQMKDISEMIVMDTIMSQADRFGNVHYVQSYYFSETDGQGGINIRSEKKLTAQEIADRKAVLVKEMLLKDNDCGVDPSRGNPAKDARLLDRVAHIDPSTYQRLLKLNSLADSSEAKDFFTMNLLFTSADYTKIRQNLKYVVNMLQTQCRSGKLQLDLSLDDHFSGKAPDQQCELL